MIRGRIHIPTIRRYAADFFAEVRAIIPGAVLAVTASLMAMGITCEARSQSFMFLQPNASAPAKLLLVANEGGYSTRQLGENTSDAAAPWQVREVEPTPGCYPITVTTVKPHAAAVVDIGNDVCDAVALVAVPDGLNVRSIVSFKNGAAASSFIVPPIGAVTIDRPSVVGPVISDDQMRAYVTGYATEHTVLTIEAFEANPAAVPDSFFVTGPDVETIDAPSGVFQQPLAARGVLYLRLTLGYKQFGLTPSTKPVYCFTSNATPENGNSIVLPCGE